MDDTVKLAMAKWPSVPDCYGWLGLDARGNWYMRDAKAQAAGDFSSGRPGSKGALLRHDRLIEFIHRNYGPDAVGQWAFQNGPQRVYVELESTPLIWRVMPDYSVRSHTGLACQIECGYVDELGRLYLKAEEGLGLVHTQDMVLAADALSLGHWPIQEVATSDLERVFAYVRSPAQRQARK